MNNMHRFERAFLYFTSQTNIIEVSIEKQEVFYDCFIVVHDSAVLHFFENMRSRTQNLQVSW